MLQAIARGNEWAALQAIVAAQPARFHASLAWCAASEYWMAGRDASAEAAATWLLELEMTSADAALAATRHLTHPGKGRQLTALNRYIVARSALHIAALALAICKLSRGAASGTERTGGKFGDGGALLTRDVAARMDVLDEAEDLARDLMGVHAQP
jgi:hypothetical protein